MSGTRQSATGRSLVPSSSSSSDEPILLESPPPPANNRSRSTSRASTATLRNDSIVVLDDSDSPAASTSTAKRHAAIPRSGPRRAKRSQTKLNAVDDDDEIEFVGESVASDLAARFTFPGSASSSRSSMTSTRPPSSSSRGLGPSSSKGPGGGIPRGPSSRPAKIVALAPPPSEKPVPVPEWIGRVAVLKQLARCVVCRLEFKKQDSGPTRWRHISTCLPPVYRPPNPPPDLKELLLDALESSQDLTLLGHRAHSAAAADLLHAPGVDLGKQKRTGLNLTTVTAVHSRGEFWDHEVDTRARAVVGASSPLPSRTPSMSPEYELPPTQPLGESDLAGEFTRPARSSVSDEESFLIQAPPAIGLTQVVKDDFKLREAAMERRTEEEFHFLRATQVPREDNDEDLSPSSRPWTPSGAASPHEVESVAFLASFREASLTPKAAKTGTRVEHWAAASPDRVLDSPTPQPEVINISSTPDAIEADEQWENDWGADEWGDDAVLTWEADGEAASSCEVSSVAPSDAGVSEDEWGANATLVWDGVGEGLDTYGDGFESHDDGVSPDHLDDPGLNDYTNADIGNDDDSDDDPEDDFDEEPEYHDIDGIGSDDDDGDDTTPPATSSAMPDYKSWDTAKLQRLAKQYGYRADLGHAALVKVATDVWSALHPATASASASRTKGKGKNSATATTVCAANQPTEPRRRAPKKPAPASSDTEDAEVGSTAATNAALDAQFHAMIIGDKAFWLRILRYEPIAFDEMVSRANVAGIKTRGWKNRLKRFLDLKVGRSALYILTGRGSSTTLPTRPAHVGVTKQGEDEAI
ncbi:hypothetical protein Q8F55_003743 [Vanrija albida]|uniref:Uncharacterized protein n=1 Tax=Vanrija albida TaxID=181172 RepID=A0ABR3Q512_9TREE